MKHVFLAFTNPVAGREAEFNAWYDQFHLDEVIAFGSGMKGARRYRLADVQRAGQAAPPWAYLAWYDLEHDDLPEFHRKPWIVDKPPLKPFTGLCADDHAGWIYTPIGERIGRPAEGPSDVSGGDRFLFMAFTKAAGGRDAEFNAWYDRVHLPEIVAALPGFVSGRRYAAASDQRANQPPSRWTYLALYEVEAADADAVRAAAAGVRNLSPPPPGLLDPDHVAWVFEPLGPYHASAPRAPHGATSCG